MAVIRQLPPSVVNKIAAGEVIERPASVVKELLENSVDSGAPAIEVAIAQGGMELIRVTDNGHGIAADQLELAVTSHATSKIADADDLFRVGTLGFRGEALASIAEVSQLTLRSRTTDAPSGFELRVNGGRCEPVSPCGMAPGTSIEVANLFFNTPVRRRFLRTTQTEMGHISEAFARIALARPEIHMTLAHNERVVHDLPPTENWAERINSFLGPDIGGALIPVRGTDGPVTISGYVVDPIQSRGNNRLQYLFLNGRNIRDRSLQHALGEAYRGLLMTGRYPIAFLRIEMPPELVDVNVHPAKLEVRFVDGSRLYSQFLGAIRNKFLTTDLTARQRLGGPLDVESSSTAAQYRGTDGGPASASQSTMTLSVDHPVRDWTGGDREFRPFPGGPSGPRSPFPSEEPGIEAGTKVAGDPFNAPPFGFPSQQRATRHEATQRSASSRAVQIHNRYLVTESEEGVVVIDQHALHERIIYEQLREKVLGGKLESQNLLVPEPVPLSPEETARVLASVDVLRQIGIVVEEFGRDTVLVSAYPAMLANHNPAEMLRGVVDLLIDETRKIDARDLVDELLHMISCKAAVKAGDQLSDAEISALLEHRQLCQDAHHCPHGRPTALVFSREELDRRFKRI